MKGKVLILFLLILGCAEPFEPNSSTFIQAIVIDGLITDEFKEHEIILRKSSPIDTNQFIPLENADVKIVENGVANFVLTESSPGRYRTFPFQGSINATYQLQIITEEGLEISSEVVTLKPSPSIDELRAVFNILEPGGIRGIQILIDTRDQTNTNSFYRWEYTETYQIVAPYPKRFEWLGGTELESFDPGEFRFCWKTTGSSNVLIGSSLRFGNEISSFPIRFLEEGSPELAERYSIEAKQYSLTEDSFEFWKSIRDIGERQGSIYDKQPGLVIGNVTAANGDALVLGYFDASQVRTERIFVSPVQFYSEGLKIDRQFLDNCTGNLDTIPFTDLQSYLELFQDQRVIAGVLTFSGSGYLMAPLECTDCRFQGGDLVKPDFWP